MEPQAQSPICIHAEFTFTSLVTSAPIPYVLKSADIISTHHCGHVCYWWTEGHTNNIYWTAHVHVYDLSANQNSLPRSNGSLVIAIKPRTMDTFLILLPCITSASKSRWRSCRANLTNLPVHRVAERIKWKKKIYVVRTASNGIKFTASFVKIVKPIHTHTQKKKNRARAHAHAHPPTHPPFPTKTHTARRSQTDALPFQEEK